jgi:hypothetical protein
MKTGAKLEPSFDQLVRAIRDGVMPDGSDVHDDTHLEALSEALSTLDSAEIDVLMDATGGGVDAAKESADWLAKLGNRGEPASTTICEINGALESLRASNRIIVKKDLVEKADELVAGANGPLHSSSPSRDSFDPPSLAPNRLRSPPIREGRDSLRGPVRVLLASLIAVPIAYYFTVGTFSSNLDSDTSLASRLVASTKLPMPKDRLPPGEETMVSSGNTLVAAPPTSRPTPSMAMPAPSEAFRSGTQALRAGHIAEGVSELEYAADQGMPAAQWKLGRMYADGDGVPKNTLRAFEYFTRLTKAHGDDVPGTPQARFVANAFVTLGQYYLEGIPDSAIKPDPDRAREMYWYAASYFEDPDAQYNLGRLYLDSNSDVRDPRQAAKWLGLAARKGQYQAQALLGAMLFKGDGLTRQAALGLFWLTLAKDGARADETWIAETYSNAFAQATDKERMMAYKYLENWLRGRRD